VNPFYPILDTEALNRRGFSLIDAAEAILAGGARILQLRHKGRYSREMFAVASRIAQMCRECGAQFVVDDRADMAILLDAGLHVGQDDLPPADARRLIGPNRILGFSTHNEAQLRAALVEPADYFAIGPIFGTASKSNPDPVVGVEELRRLRPIADRPLVAIGGITRENAASVLAAGASAVAVIGDLLPTVCTKASIRERIREYDILAVAFPHNAR
jgi:thiamine-phosphate pyrophosphorylase